MATPSSAYQFAFNGFLFGAGTPYVVETVDGLADLPAIRVQDDNRGYIDGSWSGRDFLDSRTVTFDLIITGDGSHNAQYYYKQLQSNLTYQQYGNYPSTITSSAYQLGLFQFYLTSATGLQRMYGRVRAIKTPVDPEFSYGYITTQVEFYFPDPRYYDNTSTVSSGTSVGITNNGWATSCPTIYIATPPSATFNITDGTNVMYFSNVNTSQTITIDLLARTIYQNSTYARQILAPSSQWLSVSGNSSVTWTMSSGSMQVTSWNAYV
jgi:hypothetical protein